MYQTTGFFTFMCGCDDPGESFAEKTAKNKIK